MSAARNSKGSLDLRTNRFALMLSDSEVEALDDFRFANRIQTRAEAARTLLQKALAGEQSKDGA